MEHSNNKNNLVSDDELVLLSNNIDLFKFMNLDLSKFTNIDYMFSENYNKEIKKAFLKKVKLYHPDKHSDKPEDVIKEYEIILNLNELIYKILSNKNNYEKYVNFKSQLTHYHTELKNNFKSLDDNTIKYLIKSVNNGKTFEELSKEKEELHGCNKSDINKIDINEYNNVLDKLISTRNNMFNSIKEENIKLNIDDATFAELFNKEFTKKINRNTENFEVVAYNSNSDISISNKFNYENLNYNDIYDQSVNEIDSSFELLSSNIPEEFTNNKSPEDRINEYNNDTETLIKIVKQVKS
jgi:curved DNA-binding protein CbpA